jgi:hypothetical protein
MLKEAEACGLGVESHLLEALKPDASAKLHNSRRHVFRFARPLIRLLQVPDIETRLHESVGERWRRDPDYRPPNLKTVGFEG